MSHMNARFVLENRSVLVGALSLVALQSHARRPLNGKLPGTTESDLQATFYLKDKRVHRIEQHWTSTVPQHNAHVVEDASEL